MTVTGLCEYVGVGKRSEYGRGMWAVDVNEGESGDMFVGAPTIRVLATANPLLPDGDKR